MAIISSEIMPISVADPGPLLLGVLDRWTPAVNTCI